MSVSQRAANPLHVCSQKHERTSEDFAAIFLFHARKFVTNQPITFVPWRDAVVIAVSDSITQIDEKAVSGEALEL